MTGIRFQLCLLEDILANDIGGEQNSARSLPYIPGSLVRGAVIAKYRQQNGDFDAADPDIRDLFFNGKTRFLHAYPVIKDKNKRALPLPLSFRQEKDDDRRIYDLCFTNPDVELKAVEGLGSFEESSVSKLKHEEVERRLKVHNQRDAKLGRATETSGAMFRYEALPSNTLFEGFILTERDDKKADLEKWLTQGELHLGGARTAGYGSAKIQIIEFQPHAREVDLPILSDDLKVGQILTITFLSNALFFDNASGQYTLDPTAALEKHFGQGTVKLEKCFRQAVTTGGFNRKWGLPLDQAQAIAAGSVFKYKLEKNITADKLRTLEWQGLGERRVDGFGRVAVNWLTHEEYDSGPALLKRPDNKDGMVMNDIEKSLAKQMLERMARDEIQKNLLIKLSQTELSLPKGKTQISNWRVLAQNALADKALDKLLRQLEDEREKSSRAWRELERFRINHKRFPHWLDDVLKNGESPWHIIDKPSIKQLGEVEVDVTETLRTEFKLRLIEGVLAKAAKQKE